MKSNRQTNAAGLRRQAGKRLHAAQSEATAPLSAEERLRLATDSAQIGVWDYDVINNHVVWDERMYALYGIRPEDFECVVQAWEKAVHPDDIEQVNQEVQDAIAGRTEFNTEFRVIWPDGQIRFIEAHAVVQRGPDGSAQHMIGVNRDITARKQLENEGRKYQELLESTNVVANVGGWELNLITMDLSWTLQTCRIHEVPDDYQPELAAAIDFYAPEARPIIQKAVHEGIEHGTPWDLELPFITAKGRRIWVRAAGKVQMANGRAVRLYGAFQDITARKRADSLIVGQKRILELIALGTPLQTVLTELIQFIESQANELIGSILLLDPDGVHLRHGAAPSLPDEYNQAIDGVVIGESVGSCGTAAFRAKPVIVQNIETDPLWADYKELALKFGLRACWSTPILDSQMRVLGTFAIYHREPNLPTEWHRQIIDLATDTAAICLMRDRGELALRESEERYRMLANNADDLVTLNDTRGNHLYLSPSYQRITGWTPHELNTLDWSTLVHPDDLEVIRKARAANLAGQTTTIEHRFRHRDKQWIWMESRCKPIKDQEGSVEKLLVWSRDITERKRAEEALRASEIRFRTLAENAPVGIFQTDPAGDCLYVNDRWCELAGLTPEQAAGKGWSAALHPEDRERVLQEWHRCAASGEVFYLDYRFLTPKGETRWLAGRALALNSNSGVITGYLGTVADITDHKLAEQRIIELNASLERRVAERTAELEAANKELESFSYSVSHDLRAPLRGIDGWSLALMEDYSGRIDARATGYITRIRSESQRLGELIDDLLELARVGRAGLRREPINLSAMVREIWARTTANDKKRVVEFKCEPRLKATGDAQLIEIALTNLLENAWKFTGNKRKPKIEFGRSTGKGANEFFIRDNGAGFDMKYARRLFGAFQRMHTQDEFPGTGVGLASVQRIIQRHGGKIRARAKISKGCTIFFTLPNA